MPAGVGGGDWVGWAVLDAVVWFEVVLETLTTAVGVDPVTSACY